jgi:hypothetical protein
MPNISERKINSTSLERLPVAKSMSTMISKMMFPTIATVLNITPPTDRPDSVNVTESGLHVFVQKRIARISKGTDKTRNIVGSRYCYGFGGASFGKISNMKSVCLPEFFNFFHSLAALKTVGEARLPACRKG